MTTTTTTMTALLYRRPSAKGGSKMISSVVSMLPSNMRTRITTSKKTTATTIHRLRPSPLSGYRSSSATATATASASLVTTQTAASKTKFSSDTSRSFFFSSSSSSSSSSTKGRRSSSTTTTTATTTSTTLVSPLKPHDVGGFEGLLSNATNGTIDEKNLEDSPRNQEENVQFWERQCHALFAVLSSKKYIKTDELRRTIEALEPSQYVTWTYYEKWTAAMVSLLLESNTITYRDLRSALIGTQNEGNDDIDEGTTRRVATAAATSSSLPLFEPGDVVRVRPYENNYTSRSTSNSNSNNKTKKKIEWKRPHIRTPGYIYGVKGTVVDVCGKFDDPSVLAFFNMYRKKDGDDHDKKDEDDDDGVPCVWLYRIEVLMSDLWPEQTTCHDVVSVEVYEHWLEPTAESSPGHAYEDVQLLNHNDSDDENSDCTIHHHHTHHNHDGHDHSHDPRQEVERRAVVREEDQGSSSRPGKELFYALLQIVVDDKNLVTRAEIRTMVEALEKSATSLTGASLVVKAWMDPEFKRRLLTDPAETANEIGIVTSNPNAPTVLSVVECTPDEHQLVVCTLCSCYPSGLLGISPSWYRDRLYRARAVREPRKVLEDFGTIVPPNRKIRVHDSTADHRYLVLPQRPENTEGWKEEDLRKLVTRDSMIGVTIPTVSPK